MAYQARLSRYANGRTLKQRTVDILAFSDRPDMSNGPTEAVNGRLEHLRGSVPGFRNLTSHTARALLETGGFGNQLPPLRCEELIIARGVRPPR